MDDKMIYGVTAIFETPDEIIHAAKATSAAYKKYDIHTPYPVHGMPKAMKLKPSKLGYFSLAFGLTGTAIALLFMWWSMSVDYPLIIGGKPFFSLPAFIPVTFELTVLLASVGAVLTMLFFLFKLPNNSHPLHDTDYMKSVSVDKFGLCIEAKDDEFNEQKAVEFLKGLGGRNITTIHYSDEVINFKPKIFEKKFVVFLIIAFIVVSGATYFVLNQLLFMSPFNWMVVQSKLTEQKVSNFFSDGNSMRPPVEGTVSRGNMPFAWDKDPEMSAKMAVNPLMPTKEILEKGKAKFNTFCSPCHGFYGKGDSRLRGQYPNPPSLHSEKIRNWTDGRIYHVIMMGQNVMPSYASQLNQEERWSVITYIRALQRAVNAKEGDLQ